ncbi:MAG: hypothetical protein ABRQ26_06805 [Syntrophomonadaceae bacterium]
MNLRIGDTLRKFTGMIPRSTAKINQDNIQVSQTNESPILTITGDDYSFRYAYARSSDTRKASDTGQDYLAIYPGNSFIAFVLCDGVSQSYYGDLSARFLGNILLDWLKFYIPETMDVTAIKPLLGSVLDEAVYPGSALVDRHQLPTDIPELLRSVLYDKKRMGSETTFVCCRADLPNPAYPMGRAVFAWLGDSRLRIWDGEIERSSELPGAFETMQRWSTRRGQLGSTVHAHVRPLLGPHGVHRIVSYSDGLSILDDSERLLTNWDIQQLIDKTEEQPTSDDISFIEILFEPWKSRAEGRLAKQKDTRSTKADKNS